MNASSDTAPSDVEIIRASGLFDPAYYLLSVGIEMPDPIEHYVKEGETRGIAPSSQFDPRFYRQTNPDVAEADVCMLLHFILHGRMEGRYATSAALAIDADTIRQQPFVSLPDIKSPPPGLDGLSEIERHLLKWRFDREFYARTYEDVEAFGKPPLIHYLEVGQKQQRPVNRRQLSDSAAELQPFFDEDYYRKQAGLSESGVDSAEHYLTVGRFRGYDPSPNFAASYYLRVYPDVAQNGIDPFTHYIRYAKNDKRTGQPDFSKGRIVGSQSYDPARPTILIANHDASRTGAPLVGLEAARHFSKGHNVFVYCPRDGELIEEFSKSAVYVNVGMAHLTEAEYFLHHLKTDYHLDALILNSAETSAFASAALYAGVRSVALIHEFAETVFPPGRMARMISAVDRAIVPAKLVFDSVQRDVEIQFGRPSNNVVIRPQGCLPALPSHSNGSEAKDLTSDEILGLLKAKSGKKPPIVLGAGFTQMRKGVELFVQTAHELRRQFPEVRFVWVGAGYTPKSDSTYSVWLAENVRLLKLENTVFFIPPQSQLDVLFELSDVFFLSSRLDPFPSVVLDAFKAGRPVVCFEKATGAAELFQNGHASGTAVEYLNVAAAAEALAQRLREDAQKAGEVNRNLVARRFRFDNYVDFLKQQIGQAKIARAEIERISERILASGLFDNEFHEGGAVAPFNVARPSLDYVSRAVKGLEKFSPRPGFNDGLYRSQHRIEPGEVPFDHALRQCRERQIPATHRCIDLETRPSLRAPPCRTALHVHLFYPEIAHEFVKRLNAVALPIDLFVTTTEPSKHAAAKYAFSNYRHGAVIYIEVPNRGRDIGPFLTALEGPLAQGNYEVVGHLHSKRSLAIDAAMGERWRNYLLNILLGDTFSHLSSLFLNEQKLGLVFAEDRHAVGWNKNYEIAKKLAECTTPQITVPSYPYFPLGTMFWARRAALSALWSLKLKIEDFPIEPAPNDGTVLHAVERLLPAACEAAGFEWCTVYDRRYAW